VGWEPRVERAVSALWGGLVEDPDGTAMPRDGIGRLGEGGPVEPPTDTVTCWDLAPRDVSVTQRVWSDDETPWTNHSVDDGHVTGKSFAVLLEVGVGVASTLSVNFSKFTVPVSDAYQSTSYSPGSYLRWHLSAMGSAGPSWAEDDLFGQGVYIAMHLASRTSTGPTDWSGFFSAAWTNLDEEGPIPTTEGDHWEPGVVDELGEPTWGGDGETYDSNGGEFKGTRELAPEQTANYRFAWYLRQNLEVLLQMSVEMPLAPDTFYYDESRQYTAAAQANFKRLMLTWCRS
jgi:hypothetical protein